MLRGLLLALVAANILFWAWAQGWMAPTFPGPRGGQAEPQRLASQLRPEWVRVLPAGAASASVAAARQAALACLEAGPLDDAGVQATVQGLAAAGVQPGRWTVVGNEGDQWVRLDKADAPLRALLQPPPEGQPAAASGFKACRVP